MATYRSNRIEVLNRGTTPVECKKPPTIQIFDGGQVKFSVETCKLLGLKESDKIEFIINNDDDGIIYFHRASGYGFPLIKEITPGGQTRFIICSRPLVRRLLSFFKLVKSRTFGVTSEMALFNDNYCWFILKSKSHTPLKWKKGEKHFNP